MQSKVALPKSLQGIFFDDVWETSKIWELETRPEWVGLGEIEWHLDLTVWTTVPGEARWDLSPRTVLNDLGRYPWHADKIRNADLAFPLEMFQQDDRWVIIDGYHRLARHHLERSDRILVRRHRKECWDDIVRGQ